ncbi:response regulator [Rhodanobacter glycinis]|uniref:Response regulator n=2 Tax=Rhodanobacter glycinis TaxID=582702 RepID=A0A502C2H4_9GAMM|nr:response regulator [Rhodanobacter glycinis]
MLNSAALFRGIPVETKKTVLIVDDDDLVLQSLDMRLSMTDSFQTIQVKGCNGALSHMQNAPSIDVIVADVILAGGTNGIDLCQRAIERYPNIAVVVITADNEVDCAEIPPRGVFLRKPFSGERLLESIGLALKRVSPTFQA